jgi:hypothetical protein
MLTAGVMWLFGVPFIVVILIYFIVLRKQNVMTLRSFF